ncbi:MAG: POLO box duplicated region [Cyanobium sp. M30B3]|jgi:hypothetical protein|nr:MAG: POLO box duplicated region [Cyanobium sp. M30B3]
MAGRQLRTILAGMALALVLLLWLPEGAAGALAAEGPLAGRILQWPQWRLPAPLQRPGRRDLVYPDWFLGDWQVSSSDGLSYPVRFIPSAEGVVGDRSFNAAAVGRALLGEQLAAVANDPANPNRQVAHLRRSDGQRLALDSTVVGRRREQPAAGDLLVDELALQVLHGAGEPAVSRVETLTRFHRLPDGSIQAEQWQATYGSPAGGLGAAALRSDHLRLRLERVPPPVGRAS